MTIAAAQIAPANPVHQSSGQSTDTSTQQHRTLAAVEEVNQKRHLRERHVTNYSEDYVQFDNLELDERPYKRAREDYVASVPSVAASHLELETAWAVVVNAGESILDEEEDLLPPGAHEQVYVQVRNIVVAKWREDVSRYLTEKEAVAAVGYAHRPYAIAAWRFLSKTGYINFGVAPGMSAKQSNNRDQPAKGTVVVVGAGMAGLAAARQLNASGYKVVIVEGHGRPGGRVYTKQLKSGDVSAVADLGGSILTGIDGNPLAVLAKQLQIPLHVIDEADVPLYHDDGQEANTALDQEVEKKWNDLLDECSKYRDAMGEVADNISLGTALETLWATMEVALPPPPPKKRAIEEALKDAMAPVVAESAEVRKLKRQLLDWHMANLEFANAAVLRTLSMRSWDQDDPYEIQGSHCFLPGCNLRLVKALAEGLPILYNHVVQEVKYDQAGVRVTAGNTVIAGDAVIVTSSLGVLKRGGIQFSPALPERKLGAIKRLGFGVLNKVVMLFEQDFWGGADMFGRLAPSTQERGKFFLFYSYSGISGGPLLAALVSGEAAEALEKVPAGEAVAEAMTVLRGIFEPQGISVPTPLQACCTRWGEDPLVYGSYSSVGVGSQGTEDYDIMAESIGERLFFAGEGTTRKFPATMHGAFASGLREAANVDATLSRLKHQQAQQEERKRLAAAAAAAAQNPVKQEHSLDPDFSPRLGSGQLDNPEADDRAVGAAQMAHQMSQVFDNDEFPPDAEFGCFQVVMGPLDTDFANDALIRLDVGDIKKRGAPRRSMPIFFTLSHANAQRLQDVAGGDEARVNFLTTALGQQLVGRPGLTPTQQDLLQAVVSRRQEQQASLPLPPPPPQQPTPPTDGSRQGSSSGIGKALATRLADQGLNVVLVAKPDELLDAAYTELQTTYPKLQFRKVAVNLSESGAYLGPIREGTDDIDVQLIFSNAGYILTGFFEKWTLEHHLQNIECNSTSAVAITHHFLGQLIDKKLKGCIVFTSSAAACIPSPFGVTYAATKSFLSSFGASLAPEVKHLGIDVMVAHPSPVSSRFYEGAHKLNTLDLFKRLGVMPEDLPAVIFAGIGRTVFRDIGPTSLGFPSAAFQQWHP
ncbi:hypothetical protein WJX79_007286 [Trebouxia sp. C0005]